MNPDNTSIFQTATNQAVNELEAAIKLVRATAEKLNRLFPPGCAVQGCFDCLVTKDMEFCFTRKDGLPIPFVESANGNRLVTCFRSVSDCGGTTQNPVDIILPKEVVTLVNEVIGNPDNGLQLKWYKLGGGKVIHDDGTLASDWGGLAHLLMKVRP